MSISYPLALPTVTGIAEIEIRTSNTVAVSESPFTGAQQAIAYPRQQWSATVTLPPMKRADAETWVAFLVSLRGRLGTFLMGDPLGAVARGSGGGTPVIDSAVDGTLSITGAPASASGWLLAGDYIQLGAGSTATLHKVLADVDTSVSGTATVEVWPYPRRTLTTGEAVTITGAKGKFRLSTNDTAWSVSEGVRYGISFDCMEAI